MKGSPSRGLGSVGHKAQVTLSAGAQPQGWALHPNTGPCHLQAVILGDLVSFPGAQFPHLQNWVTAVSLWRTVGGLEQMTRSTIPLACGESNPGHVMVTWDSEGRCFQGAAVLLAGRQVTPNPR